MLLDALHERSCACYQHADAGTRIAKGSESGRGHFELQFAPVTDHYSLQVGHSSFGRNHNCFGERTLLFTWLYP